MKKSRLSVFVLVSIQLLSICTIRAQKKWTLQAEVFKQFHSGGGIPPLINHLDYKTDFGVFGVFDDARVFSLHNNDSSGSIGSLNNTLKMTSLGWKNGGNAMFYVDERSSVFFHNTLFGNEYISTSGETPFFEKLNRTTNTYEEVRDVQFQYCSELVFYEWGSKVLLLGNFKLVNGLSSAVLWDIKKKQFTQVTNPDGTNDLRAVYSASISDTDSTLLSLCSIPVTFGIEYRVLYKGDSVWATSNYPPISGNLHHAKVVDKNHMFISTVSTDPRNRAEWLYELDLPHKKWNTALTFKCQDRFTDPRISTVTHNNQQLFIYGGYDSINGKPFTNKIIQYDISTHAISLVAKKEPPSDICQLTLQLYWLKNNLYVTNSECAFWGFEPVYVLTNADGTLPITLTNFTVQNQGTVNHLAWTTEAMAFYQFEIERSIDGQTFSRIGIQQAKNIALAQDYSFSDEHFANTTNYYRIKMIGADGTFDYSHVRKIDNSAIHFSVALTANPVRNAVRYTIASNHAVQTNGRIINSAGKVVHQLQKELVSVGQTVKIIDISTLPAGVYFLQISTEEGTTTRTFLKQ